MSGRPWTPEEDDVLRLEYGDYPVDSTARNLGRSPRAVLARACTLGIQRHPHWPAAVLERVRDFNARGLTDREIAREMGWRHDQAKHVRRRLKLPCHRDLDARRRAVLTQRQTLGVRSRGELRQLAYRRYARENGWPEDLRPREVQILNVLCAAGVPLTRRELSEAIGMRTDRIGANGSPALLKGNGPGGTYTASLLRRGLLQVLKRAGTVLGRGKSLNLYCLGPLALGILEQRAKGEPCPSTTES